MTVNPTSSPQGLHSLLPGSSQGGRFRRGLLASAVSVVLGMLGQLLLVPLFLHAWTGEQYGDWLTLSAAISYLTLLELGMHSYVGNRLSELWVQGKQQEYRAFLHSAWSFALLLWLLGLGCALAVALSPLLEFVQFASIPLTPLRALVVLLALQFLTTIPARIVFALYRTVGEFPRGQTLGALQTVLQVVITAAVLGFGGGVHVLALAQILPSACLALYAAVELPRRHAETRLGVRLRQPGLWRQILLPSFAFLAVMLSHGLVAQGTTMVAASLGAASVVVFTTLRMVSNSVAQLSNVLNGSLWPELTLAYASGDVDGVRVLQNRCVRAALGVSLCATAVLHPFSADLVALWTGGKVQLVPSLMFLLLLYAVVASFTATSSNVLMATNQHQGLAIMQLLAATVGVLASLALVERLGLAVIPACLILAELVAKTPVIRVALHVTQTTPVTFLRVAVVRPLVAGTGALLATTTLSNALEGAGALRFLVGMPAAVLLAAAALGFVMTADERRGALAYLRARMPAPR